MRSQNLRFSISGEYLTNLSRDLVTEGEWEKAYRILASGNQGKETLVHKILLGNFCLKGEDEEIYGTEDDDKEYKQKLNYIFAGYSYFAKENSWYRPYAFVNTISEDSEYVKERALFYKNSKKDKHVFLKINGQKILVLFEKIKSILPPWMEEDYKKRGLVKSVLDMMKLRTIETRGANLVDWKPGQKQEEILKDILEYTGREDFIPKIALKEEKKAREDKFYFLYLQDLQNKIKAQETEWIQIEEYILPKTPFAIWAKKTHSILISEDIKEWETVSPRGMKMQMDEPIHSDWVIGAGFNPEEFYRSDFEKKILDFLFASTYRKILVLNGEGFYKGIVTKDPEKVTKEHILVIPHAGVEFFEAAKKAKAVVSAIGGPGAHLVLNAKDEKIPLCLIQNADKKFEEGSELQISFDIGSYRDD